MPAEPRFILSAGCTDLVVLAIKVEWKPARRLLSSRKEFPIAVWFKTHSRHGLA